MMKKIKAYLIMSVMALAVFSPLVATVVPPQVASAACDDRVLGIPPWYRGLTVDNGSGGCDMAKPSVDGSGDGLAKMIWKIVLNVVEMGLVIVVYLAVGFVIYGGVQFIAGGGNASIVEKARKTIFNALIGLAIALSSIAIVNMIFGIMG